MAGILKVDQYQDFNGNNIMTSDGSGNLTLNNDALKSAPAFMATNDSTQSVSSGTWTELSNYDRVVFNTGSNYSASTNRFTPTVAGKYFFYASVRLGNISAENYLSLNKNGATSGSNDNVQTLRNDGGSTYAVQNSCIFDMNGSTDYVSVFVYQASGSNQDYGDTDYSYGRFLGYRLIGA
tara:strand:+ start:187 stop:726 length:540 start_codon:yes stop_codon:yes gene_type:complete